MSMCHVRVEVEDNFHESVHALWQAPLTNKPAAEDTGSQAALAMSAAPQSLSCRDRRTLEPAGCL